jgi:hypothetical protein
VAQGVGPEFKPQYCKKKERERDEKNKRKEERKKEKELKQKGLEAWLKWQSACLASSRPSVQSPALLKKKKKVPYWPGLHSKN